MKLYDIKSSESKIVYNEYIYVIQCRELCKIGKSKNPDERISALQKNNPFVMKIIFIKDVKDMTRVEYNLHQMFSNKRVNGEWFSLTNEDILEIKNADYDLLSTDLLPF